MCGADDSTASSSAAATTPGPPSSSSSSPPATTRPPSSPPSPPPDYNVQSDYRVRGYMAFDSIQAGGADCASSFIVACASMGPIPLRQSGTSYLRIQPPSTGYAVVNRSIIACPDVAVPISSDGDGNNLQAAGVIPADSVFPALAPVTPFVITGGGSPNTLQLRAVQTQCIYQYTVRRRGGGRCSRCSCCACTAGRHQHTLPPPPLACSSRKRPAIYWECGRCSGFQCLAPARSGRHR